MKALNLYSFTRCIDIDNFLLFEKKISDREEALKQIKRDELNTLLLFVSLLDANDLDIEYMDNWFYCFSIPQIGKEFDLLLIDKRRKVVNIELKSQVVAEEKIEKQLLKNRYYLSNIADIIMSYTFVRKSDTDYYLYKYTDNLKKTSIEELIHDIQKINDPIKDEIEDLFCPKDYLISPINTPDKFLNGNYFLTNQQAEIKNKICSGYSSKKQLYGITGAAGTGKSLLLYDLASEFREDGEVCLIHSGLLSEGHNYLNVKFHGVHIYPAKAINNYLLNRFKYVLVDETQRLYKTTIDLILENFNNKQTAICVFAYDFTQVLSKKEKNRNNPQRLRDVKGFEEMELSIRIRSNKEIFSFIRNMMVLSDVPHNKMNYKNIEIVYANNVDEAKRLVSYYGSNGYIFITLTPSQYVRNEIDEFAGNITSHNVVGQEFDKVVVILDDNFRYSEEGILQAREHPNPDYLFANLFYQNITRAKEKLALVILNNKSMFEKILTIL